MSTARICPNCGTAASESERFCANCGTRLPEAAPAIAPTIPLGRQGGEPAAPAPPSLAMPADLPPTPPAPARRGLPIWAIILLGIAGLCALGCVGTAVLLGFLGQQVSSVSATVPPVFATISGGLGEIEVTPIDAAPTRPRPTSAVIAALPTKQPEGAGGVVGGATSGGAAQVQTAAAATAAADSAAAEVGALFASANQVFRDEFADNRNAWFTGVVSEIETDVIEDGVFKVLWTGRGTTYEPYQLREFNNVIVELDCKAQEGGANGACGIIFGETTDVGFYKFEVYEDYYSLYIVPSAEDAPSLLEGDPAEIVNPGDWNRLRVIRQGDTISIFLNEVPLGSVSDSTYQGGRVGVSTASYDEAGGVEVWFDNFTIWELPS